jgi:transposase, IS30 family
MSMRRRGPSPLTDKRAHYLRLMQQGMSNSEACRVVGVHRKTGTRWKLGRTYTNRLGETWVYPPVADPEKLSEPPSGRFLTEYERIRIADLVRVGTSVREIGRQLGRSAATISREIRRAADDSGVYHPHAAHHAAVQRRARPNELKIVDGTDVYRFVADRLAKRWSPQQISHALAVEHPDRPDMQVCAETIYQAIYRPGSPLRDCSPRPLRTGRLRRHHHRHTQRTNRFIEPMKMIDTRPPEVDDRAVAGHWEGDLIVGRLNQSAIGTLVERTTRFTILVHLDGCRSAENLRDALIAEFLKLPLHLRRSLTWDQGIEMACHGEFSRAIGMPVYFCERASPWQRGTNENTNGLLRDYFPKGTDLFQHSAERLAEVADELNHRPRRTLGWSTPATLLAILTTPSRCVDH